MRFSRVFSKVTVDGFIFVGTKFRGLGKIHTFVGFKIRFPSLFIQKFAISWALEFVDRIHHENHENVYPEKIKPSTVFGISSKFVINTHALLLLLGTNTQPVYHLKEDEEEHETLTFWSLFSYFNYLVSVTAGRPDSTRVHM